MRKTLVFFLLLTYPVTGFALGKRGDDKAKNAPKPNLSGTWQREVYDTPMNREAANKEALILKISHQEPEIKITHLSTDSTGTSKTTEMTYYTDERGETNTPIYSSRVVVGDQPGNLKRDDVQSKTKWDGQKLVTKSSEKISAVGMTFYIDMKVTKELSADGNTLTIKTTITARTGGNTIKEVFKRIS